MTNLLLVFMIVGLWFTGDGIAKPVLFMVACIALEVPLLLLQGVARGYLKERRRYR